MSTDPPRLARLLADQFVKNQIVYNIIDNKIKLKLKSPGTWNKHLETTVQNIYSA